MLFLYLMENLEMKKKEEINIRREERHNKWVEYDKLKDKENLTEKEKLKLYKLKRTLTKIRWEDIDKVKRLLDYYGIKHIQAIGEADRLCASLVIKKKVYAVLSEDMDLFAYGSTVVIRYLSLVSHTCVVFNYKNILNKLNITSSDFKLLCAISGNDYLKNEKNIFYYYTLYQKYNKKKDKINWLDWLYNHHHLKDTVNQNELNKYKYFIIKNGRYDKENLLSLLEEERFLM